MLNEGTSRRLKAHTVTCQIRREIVHGRWAPGAQLETWATMENRFNVGRATLMRALSRLKQEGFVRAAGHRGTFVSDSPPHLCRYGLAFQGRPGTGRWNRFWQTLHRVAGEIDAGTSRQVPFFFDINHHRDEPECERLLEDVAADRLAGLIFVGPVEVMWPEAMQLARLPKIAISPLPRDADYPRLYIDAPSFVQRACDYLVSRGCRRVAVLTAHNDLFPQFPQAIEQHGMETRSWWHVPLEPVQPNCAYAVTRLLLDRAEADRPDALVVCDDNMVESAIAGIVDAGVSVPDELEVVTHCNWQDPLPTVLKTRRLGYDVRAMLDAAFAMIDLQRQGGTPQRWTAVPAQFEEEVMGETLRVGFAGTTPPKLVPLA